MKKRFAREILNKSKPFGLSLSKPLILQAMPFDKLRANGFVQRFASLVFGAALSVALNAVFSAPALAERGFTDDAGHTLRLPKPAQRIVALAPHITEVLYSAGAGEKIVGTVQYSDYPEAAKRIPRVGSYSRIDLEAVLAVQPDLVIVWESGNNMAQADKLRTLGVPVYVSQPNNLADVARQIERYGELAGTETTARAAAQAFRQRLAALQAANQNKPKVRTFYQVWKAPLITVGKTQIISDALRVCGGENVFGALPSMAPRVSLEAVIAADPEAIVATGMAEARPEWLSDWEKWPGMTAVARDNLFHINPDIMQRHTARILDGTERLCEHLDTARRRRP